MFKKILFTVIVSAITLTLYSQEISQMRVVGSAEYLPNEMIAKENRDANGQVCAGLIILTDLTGLSFDSNNQIVKMNPSPGKYFLFLSEGERVVDVYCTGYQPLKIILNEQGINLKSGQVWQVKITGDDKADQIPINIVTNPAGAKITIDDEPRGTETTQMVKQGSHVFKIEMANYKTILDTVEASTTKTLFNYHLNKVELVPVTVQSAPQGARIFLNNAEKDITDASFFEFPGKYKLKIVKQGYLEVENDIEIKEKGANVFNFQLTKNTALLTLNLDPLDAVVRINNNIMDGKQFELVPGKYVIEISKPGYLSQTDSIDLQKGDVITKNYTLVKNTVVIKLNVTPADANISINKKGYPVNNLELAPGKYQLEIEKPGFESYSEFIELKRNAPFERNIILTPKTGSLQFAVKPIDADVELIKDDKEIQTWSGIKILNDIQVGKYQLKISKEGYSGIKKEIIIEENRTTTESVSLVQSGNTESLALKNQYANTTNTGGSFSRTSTLLYSMLVPGLGQITSGRKTGWLYTVAAVGGGVYYYLSLSSHNKNVESYNNVLNGYKYYNTTAGEVQSSYSQVKDSYSKVKTAMYIAAGVYAVNLIDALIFSPESETDVATNSTPKLMLVTESDFYGIGLNIKF